MPEGPGFRANMLAHAWLVRERTYVKPTWTNRCQLCWTDKQNDVGAINAICQCWANNTSNKMSTMDQQMTATVTLSGNYMRWTHNHNFSSSCVCLSLNFWRLINYLYVVLHPGREYFTRIGALPMLAKDCIEAFARRLYNLWAGIKGYISILTRLRQPRGIDGLF